MTIVYACCSSGRPQKFCQKTLATLSRGGFKGTLWLCVPYEELEAYSEALDSDKKNRVSITLIGAKKGLVNQRKHIRGMLPDRLKILFMDDDIESLKILVNGKLQHVENIEKIVQDCFYRMPEDRLLWGVYPLTNALWMKERQLSGNCYIVGAFYGCINDPELIEPEEDECEDYARQLSEQSAGRPPVRYEWLGITTRYFKNAGGLQQERSPLKRAAAITALVNHYPDLIQVKTRKDGTPDLKFVLRPNHSVSVAPSLSNGYGTTSDATAPPSAPDVHSCPEQQ
jgi:hypothetical protein